MARPFFALLSLSLLLSACTQRMICPAYQSAFIYDKNELRKKFSYFQEDSAPKMLMASKTKYLIAEPMSYRKKLRALQTVAMRPVNPVVPDSLTVGEDEMSGEDGVVPGAELDLAARSVIDSIFIVDVPHDTTQTSVDSIYVITKDKELRLLKYNSADSLKYDESSGKYVSETPNYQVSDIRYNVEQDNYMWYLRNNLILPDVRLSQMQQNAEKKAEGKGKDTKKVKKKKGFLGFFKNLFKKKDKEVTDTTELQLPRKPSEDFDFIEEDSTQQQDSVKAEVPASKKSTFSFLKKKDKPSSQEEEALVEEKPKKKKREKKPKDEPPVEAEEVKAEEDEDAEGGF